MYWNSSLRIVLTLRSCCGQWPGLTGHFECHRNSVIPTVILGGDDRIHFSFHPEKDDMCGDDILSSLQKMDSVIL